MAKITEVIVESPTELKLNQDAKKGDYIDLKDLMQVDLSPISQLIKEKKDEEFNKLLESEKEKWKLQSDKEINNINSLNLLNEQKLKNENQRLSDAQEQVKKDAENNADKNYRDKIEALNNKIRDLELKNSKDLNNLKTQFTKEKAELEINNSQEANKYKDQIREITAKFDNLQLQKSSTGVKALGEELETWCNNEYQNYAISGFENCTWEKDNTLVANESDIGKGTKADFIFRVYSSSDHIKENELTSVCMDMKNENPASSNKKDNSSFYKKLDSDRTKKGCEYALLVSELGMDKINDAPIIKVYDYPNMYMVRPPYFISFLSVIASLGNKYKDVLIEQNKEAISFKDSQEILDSYNKMKEMYFDKPIEQMNKKVQDILDKTQAIQKANDSIRETANDIISSTLSNMKDKIERFDIQKIAKKIDKLDD